MLSKSQIKYVQSLHQKKYRQEYGAFLVEGAKSVLELLASDFEVELLLITETFRKENARLLDNQRIRTEVVNPAELERVGTLTSNDACLAVAKTKENRPLVAGSNEFALVLDDVRDPGNLGTIIRIADWYGIQKLICSRTTADVYNPKVISATKGSFTRVNWYYCDLETFLSEQPGMAIYGAFLDGEDVHSTAFAQSGYLIMGNESNGISPAVGRFVTQRLTIPRYGGAESLNVGIATAVICDNLRRGLTSPSAS